MIIEVEFNLGIKYFFKYETLEKFKKDLVDKFFETYGFEPDKMCDEFQFDKNTNILKVGNVLLQPDGKYYHNLENSDSFKETFSLYKREQMRDIGIVMDNFNLFLKNLTVIPEKYDEIEITNSCEL